MPIKQIMDVCNMYFISYYVKCSSLGRPGHTKSSFQKFAVCVVTALGEFMYEYTDKINTKRIFCKMLHTFLC